MNIYIEPIMYLIDTVCIIYNTLWFILGCNLNLSIKKEANDILTSFDWLFNMCNNNCNMREERMKWMIDWFDWLIDVITEAPYLKTVFLL